MAKKKLVPEYQMTLGKESTVQSGTIKNIYDSIKDSEKSFYSQLMAVRLSNSSGVITLADVARNFIRKNTDDAVTANLTFSKSLSSDNYVAGTAGIGWSMYKDVNGNAILDVDNINVRKSLFTKILTYDKVNAVGGTIILSSAWAEIVRVTESGYGTNHRIQCYYVPDGVNAQLWRVNDQVRIQSGLNKYLMSYVTSVSASNSDGEFMFEIYHGGEAGLQEGDTIPVAGDTAVQWGYRGVDEPTRQNMILMSVGDNANAYPFIEQYKGVDDFTISDKLVSRISNDVYFGDSAQSKYIWWNRDDNGTFKIKGLLLADSAILGGFVFSPSFDASGTSIPVENQHFRTNDSESDPAIRLSGDGSGRLAKGAISWGADGILSVNNGHIGGFNIFDSALMADTISFADAPVESLSELKTPASEDITRQASWTSGDDGYAYTQDLVLTYDAELKFKVTTTASGDDKAWLVRVRSSLGNDIYISNGIGELTNEVFTVMLPIGTYNILVNATSVTEFPITPINYAIIKGFTTDDTVSATGINTRTKVGNDGYYSFWDDDNYAYFSSTHGFEVVKGNYGIQITDAGVKKWNGSAWSLVSW